MNRYIRQIMLPEVGHEGQQRIRNTHIMMIGAGGLGAPALPYFAGAGIGTITIVDHDTVTEENLHRQTIYRTNQIGENKATCARKFLLELNPHIKVNAIEKKLTQQNAAGIFGSINPDLILDGTDNFESKNLLNDLSLTLQTPLLSASVNGFGGQVAIFAGYENEQACYRCLFDELPHDTRNCNEAGILGTTAGLTGLLQAHIALGFILKQDFAKAGVFYSLNWHSIDIKELEMTKNPLCRYCQNKKYKHSDHKEPLSPSSREAQILILPLSDIVKKKSLIIDVREKYELQDDPLDNPLITETPLHIPLRELPARMQDLPRERSLALVCAGNIRSLKGAQFLATQGFNNVYVLDKFSL